ncbi:hypothetical protein BX666DRAFT_2027132 [Dichotomocladium elegans]|nr:hypothetical protein BX666DRAFT_2027132 [Dichotomocladium elegans]
MNPLQQQQFQRHQQQLSTMYDSMQQQHVLQGSGYAGGYPFDPAQSRIPAAGLVGDYHQFHQHHQQPMAVGSRPPMHKVNPYGLMPPRIPTPAQQPIPPMPMAATSPTGFDPSSAPVQFATAAAAPATTMAHINSGGQCTSAHPYPTPHPQLRIGSSTTPIASAKPIECIRADTETRKRNLKLYLSRDQRYQETLNLQVKRHFALAQEKKREIEITQRERQLRMRAGPVPVFGPGYIAGVNPTGVESRVVYPANRRRVRRSRELRFLQNQLMEQGEKEDTLVPIRLDIEFDGHRLRDTFTWNLNESLITPEMFAQILCEDLQLPVASFGPLITRGIQDQIQDYYLNAGSTTMGGDDSGDEKENVHSTSTEPKDDMIPIKSETDKAPEHKGRKNTELRMLIKLDITVGNRALIDQFEWDIACRRNDAESFAEKLVNELGLGGEFRTAIAHSIREQAHNYIKSLLLVGYEFNGSSILDDDLRQSFLPVLKSVIRDADSVERFTPAILELTDAEIDKLEKDRMRDVRRKRRQARGRRGIILPDREPQKTCRTGVSVPADQDVSDEQFLINAGMVNGVSGGSHRGSTPSVEPMHSQRKSALKARLNIAADAASNHMSVSPPPSQSHGIDTQGVIPLSTGNRFASMVDYSSRVALGHGYPSPAGAQRIQ